MIKLYRRIEHNAQPEFAQLHTEIDIIVVGRECNIEAPDLPKTVALDKQARAGGSKNVVDQVPDGAWTDGTRVLAHQRVRRAAPRKDHPVMLDRPIGEEQLGTDRPNSR